MHRYTRASLLVILSLSILGYLWNTISILVFPYAVDYGEAPLVDHARRILDQQPLYQPDLSSPPYIITNYPPVFPYLQAGISYITGLPLLSSGRIISFLATLSSAVLIASLAKSLTRDNLVALLATGLFLSHHYVISWSSLARVDMLALLFCLAALFILYHHWRSWRWLILALFFFLASIYTRQSYLLAGPLAAFCWLWSQDRRRALIFTLSLGCMVTGLFISINYLTQGGFYLHIIQANLNQFDLSLLGSRFLSILTIWPVILLIALVFAVFLLFDHFHHPSLTIDPFIVPGWLVFTFGSFLSALTNGKIGSNVNYFLELIAACALLGALAFHFFLAHQSRLKPIVYLVCISQLIWLLVGSFSLSQITNNTRWARLVWYHQLAAQVQEATLDGPVLSDDYLGMVVQTGQPVEYQPFEFGQLYQAGVWDPQPLAQEILSGRFPLILIGGDTLDKPCCWPPALVQAIQARYDIIYLPQLIICTPLP